MALLNQSDENFEVIIADDDNSEASTHFIREWAQLCPFPLVHVNQLKDDGFRKNEVLNKAILKSSGEFIVFIDGDCIPHRHFIKQYRAHMHENIALFGRRVMLTKAMKDKLVQTKDLGLLSLWNLFMNRTGNLKDAFYLPFLNRRHQAGIWGCNWGIHKKHLLEVNGFDEDYIHAGVGEDVDIEGRLYKNGIRLKSLKQKAIVYHLYHKPNYSDADIQLNFELLKLKQKEGLIFCKNGIVKK